MKKYILLMASFALGIVGFKYFNSMFQSQPMSKEVVSYIKNNFDTASIEYFKEIAFETEYGGGREIIRKWNKDTIKYTIIGKPNYFDSIFVIKTAIKLNNILLVNKLHFTNDVNKADITVNFANFEDSQKKYPNVDVKFNGIFVIEKEKNGELNRVSICIVTDFKTKSKYHVILEELVQSLGLMNDSFMYPKSLFYDYENEADSLTPIDIKLLRILYNSGIKSGVTKQHFEEMMESK